jgi:hypothetical protein
MRTNIIFDYPLQYPQESIDRGISEVIIFDYPLQYPQESINCGIPEMWIAGMSGQTLGPNLNLQNALLIADYLQL